MKLIAFVEGKPKAQPRITQKSKFLFGHSVEHWTKIDAENKRKGELGLLNKKGNAYKPTRYAYTLQRLTNSNKYRAKVYETVCKAVNGGEYVVGATNIPKQNLFIFYLFHAPKSWSKKKRLANEWKFHLFKPDYKNILTGVEDALYVEDSDCNAVANYKLYVPWECKEGLLILQDEEIHQFVINTAIEDYIKGDACK